ncbi:S4 domain-containing protein YaaA [Oceanirhabdus sp. W0125-5]|uniref:S4 domain-containing protein YaaA n=1 Tax=Oceanirhabdus sp. W0125-5 TaxID=2999116 RepID=UPI0022F2F970|nr:S4 domain-containing protein YaaA [Oceanirhabdus sp. W0125-5]WBW97604.1 S4 domain-containing protein YaaA [Oceanirhabdus sp. W0125-5]
MKNIEITTEYIKLDAFLKWAEVVSLGTEAKFLIQDEQVYVNDELETRRGRKLYKEDIVKVNGEEYKVV